MDVITVINIFGYWLQFLIYGTFVYLLWIFLGETWKAKQEGRILEGWDSGWRFALLLTIFGFIVIGIFGLLGFKIDIVDML